MAVSHNFKATEIFFESDGSVSLIGDLTLNGVTPVDIRVAILSPSSPGQSEAVIFGPLSNPHITIETAARENILVSLRASTRVSIFFESTNPVPDSLASGHKFSSFRFSMSRKIDS